MKNIRKLIYSGLVSVFVFILSCQAYALQLNSPAFLDGAAIPQKYTCDGDNVSPELFWSDIPLGTESFAIICDDPDAPSGIWVHWVIFNIPADIRSIKEGPIFTSMHMVSSVVQGINDFKDFTYGGPCPPPGKPHRYSFRIYALDVKINTQLPLSKDKLLEAMEGHVLARAELSGTYIR